MQEHEGHRLRLRERFESSGLDSFAQHEALELLLTYAIPRKDTKPIAKALIGRFGSVGGVLCAPYEELRCVPGIGGSAATLISLLLPLSRLTGSRPIKRKAGPRRGNGRNTAEPS